jgi:hypothetical protein
MLSKDLVVWPICLKTGGEAHDVNGEVVSLWITGPKLTSGLGQLKLIIERGGQLIYEDVCFVREPQASLRYVVTDS